MKIKILFALFLTLWLFTATHAQTPDKAKLDQFFDRQFAIPFEAMSQDKFGIEGARTVFEFDQAKNQMIQKRRGRKSVFTKEN